MLYNLLFPLAEDYSIFNLFKYLTFRTGGAVLTSLSLAFIFGPWIIRKLSSMQSQGQPIREDGPQSHILTKKGTPTMGGIMILGSIAISTILWADITNKFVWIVMGVTMGYGALGFVDDYLKVTSHKSDGVSAKLKLILQFSIAFIATYMMSKNLPAELSTHLALPFIKNFMFDLGGFYFVFAMFVLVGSSNAVNLTDGLDGLAIVPVMIVAAVFLLIAYLSGHAVFASYLQIPYIPGSGEIAVFCGALVGASLGFLWFNAPPAMVFMGDTGSLSMGGALGIISMITKHEMVLAIAGGLFVLETVSVIVQVLSFKLTGKRVFRMAPLHHHFEQKGWAESTVVIRFWIIAMILAIVGLATLKIR